MYDPLTQMYIISPEQNTPHLFLKIFPLNNYEDFKKAQLWPRMIAHGFDAYCT